MRRAALVAIILSTTALAAPSLAQTAPAPAADQAQATTDLDDPANTIVVTGSRVANRTLADSPVPVDVISSQALSASGLGETNKILNQLVPSFNFPQPSITDGTDVIRPASLRGLGPDETLVLVNGKRRHVSALINVNGSVGRGSAAVDLNTIPAMAIDRIEVLRDGASSQYGSDAIAGVINIQLKKANHGGTAQVSFGKYVSTLTDVPNYTGLILTNGQPTPDPNDSRILAANYDGERKARDGGLWVYAANIGLPIGPGFLNITGEFRDRDNTNRAGYDLRPNYNRPTAAYDAREATFNRLEFQFGDPETQDYNVFVNAGMPLGDFELYSFDSFSRRNGLSAANWRQQSSANNRDWSAISPGTTPTAQNFVPLYADGFLPFIQSRLTDYSFAGGIRGDAMGWHGDLSVVYGHDQFDYRTENSVNVSYGPASPKSFDSGGLAFGQTTVNLDLTHDFDVGFAKPLTLALGAEYRNENFKIRPGELTSYAAGPYFVPTQTTTATNCAAQGGNYNAGTSVCTFPGRAALVGAQGFPGFPASARTDASRHSYAGYGELDTDIIDGLTATASVRYEHFSDFGSTVNGKFAARYEIVHGFGIRGSISNGFRAPSLHQQFFTTTSTNFINGLPVDISTLPVSSPVAQALGSKPLKPEKSLNISAGATANPFRGFTLTGDYYHIKIRDRIVLSENLGAAGSGTTAVNNAVKAVLDANGFQSVGAARFFINGLDTTTEGFDIVGTYRFDAHALGSWSLSAAYNHNRTSIDRRINTLGPLATIPGIVLFGRVEGIRFTDGQPRDKLVLSADDKIGDFGLTLRTTRYGRVIAPGAVVPIADPTSLTAYGPDDVFLKPKFITDFEVSYTFKQHATFAFGMDNMFDIYPTHSPVGNRPASIGGQYPIADYYQPYSSFSPFGFNGRFIYGRFTASF